MFKFKNLPPTEDRDMELSARFLAEVLDVDQRAAPHRGAVLRSKGADVALQIEAVTEGNMDLRLGIARTALEDIQAIAPGAYPKMKWGFLDIIPEVDPGFSREKVLLPSREAVTL